ncbi:hypothetical protein AGMMS49982_21810 [Bacteroidia bacterium]|nr:hypothetical protein AGMMS49982_21810 [Bacteroidia bacterium]
MANKTTGNKVTEKIALVYECVMPVFYVVLSGVFLCTNYFPQIAGWGRGGIALVLAVYGIYRVRRALARLKAKREEESYGSYEL